MSLDQLSARCTRQVRNLLSVNSVGGLLLASLNPACGVDTPRHEPHAAAGSGVCATGMVAIDFPGGRSCIDATETTIADYAIFLGAGGPSTAEPPCDRDGDHVPYGWQGVDPSSNLPVTGIDWCDAVAYCQWRGKRLCGRLGGGPIPLYDGLDYSHAFRDPEQSEWYRACTAGGALRYPYGDTLELGRCFDGGETGRVGSRTVCEGGLAGLFDMSGNVWEWVDASSTGDGRRVQGGGSGSEPSFLECAADSTALFDSPLPWNWHLEDVGQHVGIRCCGLPAVAAMSPLVDTTR